MTVYAEISLYPLKTTDITQHIVSFLQYIASQNLHVEYGRLSSIVSGECSDVFSALNAAFERCCDQTAVAMCLKITNIAPPALSNE